MNKPYRIASPGWDALGHVGNCAQMEGDRGPIGAKMSWRRSPAVKMDSVPVGEGAELHQIKIKVE